MLKKEEREYDVIVAGAGPAGICAAVAAARRGSRVALVERYGVVGGNLTAGFVGPILGMVGKGTMRDEVLGLLGVSGNDMIGESGIAHDMERAKLVLSRFVNHPLIDVYLQSTVSDVIMDDSFVEDSPASSQENSLPDRKEGMIHARREAAAADVRMTCGEEASEGVRQVCGVVTATNEGPIRLLAPVTVDATGDAVVSFLAGAHIEKGREDGLMQPVTLEFRVDGLDEEKAIVCIGDVDDVELFGMRFLDWCRLQADKGLIPQKMAAVRLHPAFRPGSRQVNTTQVNGVDITDVSQIFHADLELREQIEILVSFLKEYVPGYENCYCVGSGTTTGVRESRRVMGDYVVTAEELSEGCRFPDVVVHRAEFIVDIHNPEGPGQAEPRIQYCKPYDLPYRCFLPSGLEGLLVAGRCISGTHRAHASYRVMSICMAMGEAVGMAASLSAQMGCTPRQLDVAELQAALQAKGVELFD